MKVVVVENLTLDGVMQAPARPDEDTRGGFRHGGWAVPFQDSVAARVMGERMSVQDGGALLLGRRTYLNLFEVWPKRSDNPYTDRLNNSQKYVASRTLEEPLPWMNSTLLKGDAADAVAELKQQRNLAIIGSGALVQSLMRRNLIDEYLLSIYPLILGSGLRLFPDEVFAALRLTDSVTTTTGVVIATYQTTDQSGATQEAAAPAAGRKSR